MAEREPARASASLLARAGLALALLLAAGLGAWLLAGDNDARLGAPEARAAPEEAWTSRVGFELLEERRRAEALEVDAGAGLVALVRVLDEHGAPLSGATVELHQQTRGHHFRFGPSVPLEKAKTDAQGEARLSLEHRGALRVFVTAPFYATASRSLEGDLVFTLQPLAPVRGRVVLESGAAAAGARVCSTSAPVTETTADAAGRFELRVPERTTIAAGHGALWGVSDWLLLGDEDEPTDLRVGVGKRTSARVLRRDGEPFPGARVRVSVGCLEWTEVTLADGVFGAPVAPDLVPLALEVSADGFVPVTRTLSRYAPAKDVVLSRPSRLEVEFVDEIGAPVPSALVDVEPPGDSARTDERGRFALDGLGEEAVMLSARVDERTAAMPVELPEGETTRARLVLRPEVTAVPLEVLEPDGSACRVYLAVARPRPDRGWTAWAKEGPRSRETLKLARGTWALEVSDPHGHEATVVVDVDPHPDMAPVRVTLSRAEPKPDDEHPLVELRVRVVDEDARPVLGAQVASTQESVETSAEGLATLWLRPRPNDWPLQVRVWRGELETGFARVADARSEQVITLRRALTITGRVEGERPRGAYLTLNSALQMDSYELEGSSFVLKDVSPVRGTLCLVAPAKHEGLGDDRVLACALVDGPGPYVLRSGPSGTLSLRVLDEHGAPVTQPLLYVDRVRNSPPAPDGVAAVSVPPGTHVLVVNIEGSRARAERLFEVRPGQTTDLGEVRCAP